MPRARPGWTLARGMYVIRADATHVLHAGFSGRPTTEEALRALSQAFALAEAGGIMLATCDIREVERAPGNLVVLAAAFAACHVRGMQVAFVSRPEHHTIVRRFTRYTGVRVGLGVFEHPGQAMQWLTGAAVPALRSSTESRHYSELARQWQHASADAGTDALRQPPAA